MKEDIVWTSGKTGLGIEKLINSIIKKIPHPTGCENKPLQALIFDSVFNPFRGIEAYFKIVNGRINKGDKVKFFATGKTYIAEEVGILKFKQEKCASIASETLVILFLELKTLMK